MLIDIHCHSRRILYPNTAPEDFAGALRRNRVSVAVLNVVPDGPLLAFTPGGISVSAPTDDRQIGRYVAKVFEIIESMVAAGEVQRITSSAELAALSETGTPGIVVGIEGADHLGGDLSRIDRDYDRHKLRQMGLVHYLKSALADNQTEEESHNGISAFGKKVVQRCNALGIIVDLAHLSERAMRAVIACSAAPVICSHSSIRDPGDDNVRLMPAEIAREIAATGGLIGVWPNATIFPTPECYAAGLYRLAQDIGVDHVAIGTDRAGLQTSLFPDYTGAENLPEHLQRSGFSDPDTRKILGENYIRVFAEIEKIAAQKEYKSA
ncbi:membrane dipeptidase [Salipiger sp. P9]|nr:membrane dipeptidase [Salipiger pentaromativorans]